MVTTTTSSLKGKYRQPFHNKRSNGDKILDQLKYQQKLYSLELQRSRSFVLNPLVDLVHFDLRIIKRNGASMNVGGIRNSQRSCSRWAIQQLSSIFKSYWYN